MQNSSKNQTLNKQVDRGRYGINLLVNLFYTSNLSGTKRYEHVKSIILFQIIKVDTVEVAGISQVGMTTVDHGTAILVMVEDMVVAMVKHRHLHLHQLVEVLVVGVVVAVNDLHLTKDKCWK